MSDPTIKARRRARDDGYADGWSRGYRYGCAKQLWQTSPHDTGGFFDLDVAVVLGGCFSIDRGITEALSAMVRKLTVLPPDLAAIGQLSVLKPDLVLVINGIHDIGTTAAAMICESGIRSAIWLADDPYFSDVSAQVAPYYDFVFTHELDSLPMYAALGCKRVCYLPFAASRGIFRPKRVASAYQTDICFIGTAFWNRVEFFDELAPYLKRKKFLLIGGLWKRLKRYRQLSDRILPKYVFLEDTVKYYNGARIVINLHRSAVDERHNANSRRLSASSVNPRTFEIAACGTLQLTDERSDLTRFYTPGAEIAPFRSPDDLITTIEYYLKHENQRLAVALRGMRKTLIVHHYEDRLATLLQAVLSAEGEGGVPI